MRHVAYIIIFLVAALKRPRHVNPSIVSNQIICRCFVTFDSDDRSIQKHVHELHTYLLSLFLSCSFFSSFYIYIYRLYIYIYTHTYIYIYIYFTSCLCGSITAFAFPATVI